MTKINELLFELNKVSVSPKEQLDKYINQGRKVVGCFEPYTPEEIAYAAGFVPMGMWGAQVEPYYAKVYLPAFCCPIMQSSLELGLNGSVKGLSAVMIPTVCDALRCITQNWLVGVKDIPMIPVTYPQNRDKIGQEFLISEYENIKKRLEEIAGKEITNEDINKAIDIYNEHSKVMMEFSDVACEHSDVITPTIRHNVMKSAWFMDKKEHTCKVKEIIEELKKLPVSQNNGKQVILTGIICEPVGLVDVLSDLGVTVVGDDLAHESRQYRTLIPDGLNALERLAKQWSLKNCAMIHDVHKTRIVNMKKLAKDKNANGIIACMMKFCDPEEYDFPIIKKELEAEGVKVLNIEIDQSAESIEQLRTRLQSFVEMIEQ